MFPSADPRRATLSILPHVVNLDIAKTASGQAPLDALPIGFIIEAVKVVKIIENQGVYVDIGVDGVPGFVHVPPRFTRDLMIDLSTFRSKGRLITFKRQNLQSIFRPSRKSHRLQSRR